MKSHYETLQVTPGASTQDIKDAFRFLLFRYHPDHNRGREDWAVQQTMALVEAYHVLSNPGQRGHHDLMRSIRIRDEAPKKGFKLFGGKDDKSATVETQFKDGAAMFKADEYERAIQAFRKVFDADPAYPNVRYNMALCFLAIERIPEALQWMQDHVAKNKEDAEAKAVYSRIFSYSQKRKAG